MVEFALSFVVFIFFVFFVLDIGALIYNHNLYHHALVKAARTGALGGSNDEILDEINQSLEGSYLPSIFFESRTGDVVIDPFDEIQRVDGREISLELEVTYGLGFLWFHQLTFELPVSTTALIIQHNDVDRDGCKDSLAGTGTECESYQNFSNTYEGDHRNNGVQDEYIFKGADRDADGDGERWASDTLAVGYSDGSSGSCGAGYYLYRPNNSPLGGTCQFGGVSGWDQGLATDGRYHAPEIWDDGTEATPRLFERRVPAWGVNNSDKSYVIFTLRADHDRDNDGWIDKFDDSPDDPESH